MAMSRSTDQAVDEMAIFTATAGFDQRRKDDCFKNALATDSRSRRKTAPQTYSGNRRSQTSCPALHARKFTEVQGENRETH
jgi:hypothetical protein